MLDIFKYIQGGKIMQIQKITPCNFMAKRRPVADRVATVQDLYELEDRMRAYNKMLINTQSELIGEALYRTNDFIYNMNDENNFSIRPYAFKAMNASYDLKYVRRK